MTSYFNRPTSRSCAVTSMDVTAGSSRIFCPLSHRSSCTTFCLQAFQPYMGQSTWQSIGANSMTHAGHSGASMKSSGRMTASLASGVTCWTSPGAGRQVMSRGIEWYIVRDALITEVRAYFIANPAADAELPNFPYAERGYLKQSVEHPPGPWASTIASSSATTTRSNRGFQLSPRVRLSKMVMRKPTRRLHPPTAQPKLQIEDERIRRQPMPPLEKARRILHTAPALAAHDDHLMRGQIPQPQPPIPSLPILAMRTKYEQYADRVHPFVTRASRAACGRARRS